MLRRASLNLFKLTRGPKKGKGAGKEEVKIELTTDVINIFKDRSDPEFKPLSEYPPWLAGLAQYKPHPVLIALKMYRDGKYPMEAREARRCVKWARKIKIKTWNEENISKFETHENLLLRWGINMPGSEQSESEDEEELGPFLNLALGSDWKSEVEDEIERLKANIGHLKDKQLGNK